VERLGLRAIGGGRDERVELRLVLQLGQAREQQRRVLAARGRPLVVVQRVQVAREVADVLGL
jgi:hypothetical protein